jgi:hypothetical protein
MTSSNTEWYMTAAVAKALRSKTLKIEYLRDGFYVPTNTAAYRAIYKAYDLAMKGGRIAESIGSDWSAVERALGLRVTPMMLVAAKIGAPYGWEVSAQYAHAVAALQQIESR